MLIGRIPNDGKHAVIVLTDGAAEIGVELARAEQRCKRAAHIVLARVFAAPDPASPDLDALGEDPKVRLGLRALVAVRDDVDLCPDRDGLELAPVAAVVVLGDLSEAVMVCPILRLIAGPIPCDGETVMGTATTMNPLGRSESGAPERTLF